MSLTKKILLVVLCLPMYFWGYLLAILGMVLMISVPTGIDKTNFAVTSQWRPWFAKKWRWNTCLAGAIFYQSDASPRSVQHERVHISQFQDANLLGLSLAIIWSFARLDGWNLMLWSISSLFMTPGYLGAVLRGRHVYRGCEIELSAYAQTNVIKSDMAGRTWEEIFEEEAANGKGF